MVGRKIFFLLKAFTYGRYGKNIAELGYPLEIP